MKESHIAVMVGGGLKRMKESHVAVWGGGGGGGGGKKQARGQTILFDISIAKPKYDGQMSHFNI